MNRCYAVVYGGLAVPKPHELAVDFLAAVDPSFSGRVVRDALRAITKLQPEQAHVEAVLDLARGRPGRRVSLPRGFTAVREREYIRISPPDDR